jgi:hypothetical protein
MGGQACVLYGAAEFSRDLDLLVLAGEADRGPLRSALRDLDAEPIAVPDFEAVHLEAGHAIHFRCRRPDVAGLRIDIMSRLRSGGSFEEFSRYRTWCRRKDSAGQRLAQDSASRRAGLFPR